MKKIVCIALAACFVVALVSFSSSAAVVNDVTELPVSDIYFQRLAGTSINWSYSFRNTGSGQWVFDTNLPFDVPTPLFSRLSFHFDNDYEIPEYSGRALSLSLNLDFLIIETDYLSIIPSDVDISDSAIFTSAYCVLYFSDGTNVTLHQDSYILKDNDIGQIIDPTSDVYWNSIKGNIMDLSIYALFDVSPYVGKVITSTYVSFPDPGGIIYYSNDNLTNYLSISDVVASYDFAYTPFNDVVQDDLTDIKTQLGTIDQDVNRVQQDVSDLKDTIEDFQQDLTSSDSSISSDISDKQDIIDSIQDAMQNDNALLEDNLNDMITGFPGAQDPFHDAPSPDGFFAVQFIQQLWSFIKAQTIFFDFIFLGLCFCLATFILRR